MNDHTSFGESRKSENKTHPYDFFISHASEDKETVAKPLYEALIQQGYHVWYDEFALKVGDALRKQIDRGLSESRWGIVILSPDFFRKNWPEAELGALFSRQMQESGKVVLPVWHHVDHNMVARYSPLLTDLTAVSTARGIPAVARELIRAIAPGGVSDTNNETCDVETFNASELLTQQSLTGYVQWQFALKMRSLSSYGVAELYDLVQRSITRVNLQPGRDVTVPIPDVFWDCNRQPSSGSPAMVYKSGDYSPQYRNVFSYKMAMLKPGCLVYSCIELGDRQDYAIHLGPLVTDMLHLFLLLERIHEAELLQPDFTVTVQPDSTPGAFLILEQQSIARPLGAERYQLHAESFSLSFDGFSRQLYARFFRKLLGLFRRDETVPRPFHEPPFPELDGDRLDQWLRDSGSTAH
jgi:hypothetical protein